MAEHFDGKKIELSPSKALGEVEPNRSAKLVDHQQ
jgi:hypothetical protein